MADHDDAGAAIYRDNAKAEGPEAAPAVEPKTPVEAVPETAAPTFPVSEPSDAPIPKDEGATIVTPFTVTEQQPETDAASEAVSA